MYFSHFRIFKYLVLPQNLFLSCEYDKTQITLQSSIKEGYDIHTFPERMIMVWVCRASPSQRMKGLHCPTIASLQGQRSKADSEYNKGPVLQAPLLEAVPVVLRPQ